MAWHRKSNRSCPLSEVKIAPEQDTIKQKGVAGNTTDKQGLLAALKAPFVRYLARKEAKEAAKEAQRHEYSLLCQKWAEYTHLAFTQIAFFPDHKEIEAELVDHLEERYQDYQRQGKDAATAKQQAMADMGDAVEVGRALGAIHSPLLGWVWVALKSLSIVLAVMLVCSAWDFCSGSLGTIFDLHPLRKEATLVKTIPLGGSVVRYGMVYRFDEVRFYDDNSIELCHTRFYNPFEKGIRWSGSAWPQYFSAEGEPLEYSGGGGGSGGGWITPCQITIELEDGQPEPRLIYLNTSHSQAPQYGIIIDLETQEVIG